LHHYTIEAASAEDMLQREQNWFLSAPPFCYAVGEAVKLKYFGCPSAVLVSDILNKSD
jgi:hypothetical protein